MCQPAEDFYGAVADVTRNVGQADLLGMGVRSSPSFGDELFAQIAFADACRSKILPANQPCDLLSPMPFTETDVAPVISSDPYFQLEVTTLHLDSPAFEVGNRVLQLLQENHASIVKMTRSKMSIKAHVSIQGFVCTVNVRLYCMLTASNDIVVEFQRRRGCSLSFHGFFRRAQRFFGKASIADDLDDTLPCDLFLKHLRGDVHTNHQWTADQCTEYGDHLACAYFERSLSQQVAAPAMRFRMVNLVKCLACAV